MHAERKPEFAQLLRALAGTFGFQVDPAVLEGYWIGLSEIEFDDFACAAAAALRTCKFMPRPAELVELAGKSKSAANGLAWMRVRRAIRESGAWHAVDFGPEVNAAVRAIGGWQGVCRMDSDDLDQRRRAFDEALDSARRNPALVDRRPLYGLLIEAPVRYLPPSDESAAPQLMPAEATP